MKKNRIAKWKPGFVGKPKRGLPGLDRREAPVLQKPGFRKAPTSATPRKIQVFRQNLVSSVILSTVLLTMFISSVTTHADDSSIAGSFRKRDPARIEDDSNCPQNASAGLEKVVTSVLRIQQQAWNRGDIEGFMEYYWKSEKLTFSSEGTTKRGWKATRERYKKRYPDRETMGKLTFDHLEVTALGENSAFVLGQWHLKRKKDNPEGVFSLVMRKIEGRWIIVHDHTSSKPAN